MSKVYLAHHGVIGMKWGVRRYQDKNGNLTSAGKARARRDAEKGNKWALSKHQPSSIRSSIAAGLYAANPNSKNANRLDKLNKSDEIRYKAARDYANKNKKASNYGSKETVVVKDVPYKEVSSSDRKPITRDSVNALKNDSKSTINSANNLRKMGKNRTDLSKYSDAELQKIVNRQQLEQRYNQMNPDKIDRGASILREGLEVAGGVAGIYATYKWIKQL